MKINRQANKFFNSPPQVGFFGSNSAFNEPQSISSTGSTPVTPNSSENRFTSIPNVKEFNIGAGDTAIHASSEGMWMGGKTKGIAPIRFETHGAIYMKNPLTGLDQAVIGLLPT